VGAPSGTGRLRHRAHPFLARAGILPPLRVVVLCPFSAGTVLWQAQSGAWTLSVCVRGTFALVNGREAVLADLQEPSDLVPYKPRVDVVLVGSAFAPHQEPVEALVAKLSLGGLDKALGVIGDRVWIEGPDGPEPSAARPFRSMPLGHERAARAHDNPQGFDLTRPPALGALALPNLEAADDEIGAGRTVGFGPVIPAAGARRGLLRADGWAWVEGGGHGPAPAAFDFAFYNAAPRDQQVDLVRGGDTLTLENMNREHPHLVTRLPQVRPKAFLVPGDVDRGVEITLRCDTIWIDTDRGIVSLSWRGLCTVDTPDEEALGAVVVAAESPGRDIGYAQIAKILRDGTMTSTDGDTFADSVPTTPRADPPSVDTDLDILPTPGPFRAKRAFDTVPMSPRPQPSASPRAVSAVLAVSAVPPVPAVPFPASPSATPPIDAPTATRPAAALVDAPTTTRPSTALAERPGPVEAPTISRDSAVLLEGPTTSRDSAALLEGPTTSRPSPASVGAGASAKVPAATRAPIVIEDSAGPLSWEELTGSDLFETGGIDEPKTLTRIDGRRKVDDTLQDEPSTRPILTRPLPKGELQAGDYARIAVAVERGDVAPALFQYGLTLPDLPRVQRTWTERSASDAVFAAAFARAITEARRA
jgi:hypothetical protein